MTTTLTETCPWCESPITHTKFTQIQSRIRDEEQRRQKALTIQLHSEIEGRFRREAELQKATLEEQARARIAQAAAEKDEMTAKLRILQETATQVREQASAEAEAKWKDAVLKQRELLEKARDDAVLKKQAEHNRERERLQKQVDDLQRQLKQNTANQLGDGAEIDLVEALRDAFPDDRITRIGKGQPGADIKHEVMHNGACAGAIVIDSKNRKAWQDTFVSKLRADQMEAKAEHGILSTTVFPSGEKELCIRQNVIVVSPARVVELLQVLRTSVIKIHRLGLSASERADKTEALYKFIQSERYQQNFEEVSSLNAALLEMDVQEQEQHKRTWRNRGLLLKRQEHAVREIDLGVNAILEGCRPKEGGE